MAGRVWNRSPNSGCQCASCNAGGPSQRVCTSMGEDQVLDQAGAFKRGKVTTIRLRGNPISLPLMQQQQNGYSCILGFRSCRRLLTPYQGVCLCSTKGSSQTFASGLVEEGLSRPALQDWAQKEVWIQQEHLPRLKLPFLPCDPPITPPHHSPPPSPPCCIL